MSEGAKLVGKVVHFFNRISVAVVELYDTLSLGDRILIKGKRTNFEQTVESMEIEHQKVERAEAGQKVGLKVVDRVREGDLVYRLEG